MTLFPRPRSMERCVGCGGYTTAALIEGRCVRCAKRKARMDHQRQSSNPLPASTVCIPKGMEEVEAWELLGIVQEFFLPDSYNYRFYLNNKLEFRVWVESVAASFLIGSQSFLPIWKSMLKQAIDAGEYVITLLKVPGYGYFDVTRSALEKALKAMEEEVKKVSLLTELAELKTSVEQLAKDKVSLQRLVDDALVRIKTRDEFIDDQAHLISVRDKAIAELEAKNVATSAQLQCDAIALKNDLQAQASQLKAKDAVITALERQVQDLQEGKAFYETQSKNAEERIKAIDTENYKLGHSVEELQERLHRSNANINTLKEDQAKAQSLVNSQQQEYLSVMSKLEGLQTEINARNEEQRRKAMDKSDLLKLLESDATDAGWRLAAKQLLKLTREPIIAFVSKQLGDDDSIRAKVAGFLDTELGEGVFSALLSLGLHALPATMGTIPQRLARELRVHALTDVGDVIADLLMGPLRSVIVLYLGGVKETVTKTDDPSHQIEETPQSTRDKDISSLFGNTKAVQPVEQAVGVKGSSDR